MPYSSLTPRATFQNWSAKRHRYTLYVFVHAWVNVFCYLISLPVHMSMSLALADSSFMVRFPGRLRDLPLFQIFQTGSGYRRWPPSSAEVQNACIYTSAPYDFLTHCLIRTGDNLFYLTSQHIPQLHSSDVLYYCASLLWSSTISVYFFGIFMYLLW